MSHDDHDTQEDSVAAAFLEYEKVLERNKLISSGRMLESEDLDRHNYFAGDENRINYEFYDEETALICGVIRDKAVKMMYKNINVGQLFHQKRHAFFDLHAAKTHTCRRFVCPMACFNKGDIIEHPFTTIQLPRATGEVWMCTITGKVHICNILSCQFIHKSAKGWDACSITGRPYPPEGLTLTKEYHHKNCTDYGDEDDDNDGESVDKDRYSESAHQSEVYIADGDSDDDDDYNEHNYANEIEQVVFSVQSKKRNRSQDEEAFVTAIETKYDERKELEAKNAKREQLQAEKKMKQRSAIITTNYALYAKNVCTTMLKNMSRRKDEMTRIKKIEIQAIAAFNASIESRPGDFATAMTAYSAHFSSSFGKFHPSIMNPEFSDTEIEYYSHLLLSMWKMVCDTKMAQQDTKLFKPKAIFISMFYILETGFCATLIVEKTTRKICKSSHVNCYNMDQTTMECVVVPIIGKHTRLACLPDKSVVQTQNRSCMNINNGIKKIKNCFNSKIDEFVSIDEALAFTLSHYC